MTYAPPSVGVAGLTIPSYNDILNYLLGQYRSIYGQNVYLGNDSADFQWISVVALALSDTEQAIQLDYNNRSPSSAIGAALDSLVKLNGIARKVASFSTAQVTLTGTPGTVITNGIVQDTATGNKWDLPSSVTIGIGGTVSVAVTCEVAGAIAVPASTITTIVTPTAGWISVTNPAAANPGQPVEPDSALRARQTISTELPSITTLAGTIGAIAATPGVTRYNVLENYTSVVDMYGNPPNSITSVVEGGTGQAIAQAIYNNRGIGCYPNGTTLISVQDPNTGLVTPIRFSRPNYIPIFCTIGVKQLAGYPPAFTALILSAVVNYLNSLQIGESLTISGLYGAALAIMPNLSLPVFSIISLVAGTSIGTQAGTDIPVNFDEVTQGTPANVVINLS